MKHYIKHPKFAHDELHGKRLCKVKRNSPIQYGQLTVREFRAEDGQYVLLFQPPWAVDGLERPWTKVGEPRPEPSRITPIEITLDQDTVCRIRAGESSDRLDCDFVLEEP